jgi:hypothetical protein
LRAAFGPSIAGYLEDQSIVEIMLNPDGRAGVTFLDMGDFRDGGFGLRLKPS